MIKIGMGLVFGGVFGFFYYRYIGCRRGSCFIAGSPYISTLYWAVLGGLLAHIL
ncbi:hypothetical protein KGY73_09445 [bacterium]|nr:hypothetical protein [bacterium]